ncbi:MAG: hypothetical protein R3D60_04145 [Paracoccaceae bacterium]
MSPTASLPPVPQPVTARTLPAVPASLAGLVSAAAGPRGAPLCPVGPMTLARGRVHEVTGSARRTLAAMTAQAAQAEGGVVFWFHPGWRNEELCPQGLARFIDDVSALIVVRCTRPVDVLWGMEEVLRSGAATLAVGTLAEAPDLRQLRRLTLAAGTGLARARLVDPRAPGPLGVVMHHETAESRIVGVESRWALDPLTTPGRRSRAARGEAWRLERRLMPGCAPQAWDLWQSAPGNPPECAAASTTAPLSGDAGQDG